MLPEMGPEIFSVHTPERNYVCPAIKISGNLAEVELEVFFIRPPDIKYYPLTGEEPNR
jgi:hypothetical protein